MKSDNSVISVFNYIQGLKFIRFQTSGVFIITVVNNPLLRNWVISNRKYEKKKFLSEI